MLIRNIALISGSRGQLKWAPQGIRRRVDGDDGRRTWMEGRKRELRGNWGSINNMFEIFFGEAEEANNM